jgi:hypothetical protein
MTTPKTFTTDQAVYTIELDHNRRVDRFEDGVAVWEDVTTYRIMRDGKLLTVCYNEADIAGVIDCQENPARYAGMGHRLD